MKIVWKWKLPNGFEQKNILISLCIAALHDDNLLLLIIFHLETQENYSLCNIECHIANPGNDVDPWNGKQSLDFYTYRRNKVKWLILIHSYKNNHRSECIPEGNARTKVIIFCKSRPSDCI